MRADAECTRNGHCTWDTLCDRAMYLRSAGSKDGAVTVGPVRNFVIIDRAKERHARDGRAALGPGRR